MTMTIATTSEVFRALGQNRERIVNESGGISALYMPDGTTRELSNLGWLNRHSEHIHDLWVVANRGHYGTTWKLGASVDAILGARMDDGTVYVCPFASQDVLCDFLERSDKYRGRPVHWNCHAMIVDDRDWHRMQWEIGKRRQREIDYRAAHPEQFSN